MESWYKVACPQCGASNWINNGDENDMSTVDVEEVKCHACLKRFDILAGLAELTRSLNDGVLHCEWGRKSPEEPWRPCPDDDVAPEQEIKP